MSNALNRREMLKAAVGMAAAAGALATSPLLQQWAAAQQADGAAKIRKLLFFSKSGSFVHPCITRKREGELSFGEKYMEQFGKQHNFDVTCTKDGRVFTPQHIAQYDAFVFVTQGDPLTVGKDGEPAMTRAGKQALLQAIADGKGFLGLHCASDTFHSPKNGPVDPYIEMLGGEFVIHHQQQSARIIAVDQHWAPTPGLETFTKHEEWYILKNFAPDLHVLLMQDTKSMREDSYKQLEPYPETWARMHNKGRVFFSSMGHREDVWESPEFQRVLLGGLNWVTRNVDADVTPNIAQVAPGVKDLIRKSAAA